VTATERKLKSLLEPALRDTFNLAGVGAAKALPALIKTMRAAAPGIKGFAFDKTLPQAQEWAAKRAAKTIKGISATTRDEIRGLVESAFEDQFTVDDLADEIDRVIGDEARSETIARTETMTAANAGQQEAWDQAVDKGLLTGTELQVWIVTPDDRLCPICEPLDGVTAGLDETFEVDGDAIDGPPAHPNCRCTIGLQAGS
jgi:SPP1 gp7 family putative phage head morphogenesis protein